MLPKIEVICFVQKSLLVRNEIENGKSRIALCDGKFLAHNPPNFKSKNK
jgi:hypothetical protein